MHSTETIIDHRQRIRRVMAHINRHLDEKYRLEQLAEVACFSPFHFIRVFETVMGETPQQYVIRKRMERAGFYLLKRDLRITEIAFNVAYETSSSFCKVFKTHFGISPRQFRDTIPEELYYKTNHPFRSSIAVRNRTKSVPVPTIKTLPSIKVVYIENRGVLDGSFLATALISFKRLETLIADNALECMIQNFVSIYPYRPLSMEDNQALNFVGAIVDGEIESLKGLHYCILPPGRYAVFNHYGAYEFIPQTWNQAYMNWLPRSGQSLRDTPPLEIHLNADLTSNKLQLKAHLLIPIV
jgi:AraC family transcriptional regulator